MMNPPVLIAALVLKPVPIRQSEEQAKRLLSIGKPVRVAVIAWMFAITMPGA
jgi:hypothetical protein